MQNKKSVVFIEPENMLAQARSIRKELIKDTQFAGVVIAEKKLRCLVKNAVFDKFAPEGGALRRTYKKLRRQVFKKNPEHLTYGDACGLPQKTVRNLLYRFVPDIVVVSTEEALRSILVERKKLGVKCSVCVLCNEKTDGDIIAQEAEYYFVKGVEERNTLLEKGVLAEKVVMGTVSLSEEIAEEEKRTCAKENLGLSSGKFALFIAEGGNEDFRKKIKETLSEAVKMGLECIFYCGTDSNMAEFISDCGGRVASGDNTDDLVLAADVVVALKKSGMTEKASELKRAIVDGNTDGNLLDAITEAMMKKAEPAQPTPPYRFFADCLKNILEQKLNAEPIEPEEDQDEKGDWTIQRDPDDEEE